MSTTTQVAPSTSATRSSLDIKATLSILNSRVTLKPEHIGQQLVLSVSGNGQFLPQGFEYSGPGGKTENQFDRWIYNLRANSAYSMSRPENKLLFTNAMKAESAGDMATASELFNEWLNAIQISFSVIDRPSAQKFTAGDQVKAVVAEVVNAAGAKQLVVNDVRLKPAVVVAAVKFTVDDLLAE